MSLVFPSVGDELAAKRMLNISTPDNVVIHLYVNNYTPVKGSVLANFTECTATGYAAVSCTAANWTVSTVSGTTEAAYPEITWTLTSAAPIYGYYVTNADSSVVIWAEQFASVESIQAGGGKIAMTPSIICN
jgi:hypothetical protein